MSHVVQFNYSIPLPHEDTPFTAIELRRLARVTSLKHNAFPRYDSLVWEPHACVVLFELPRLSLTAINTTVAHWFAQHPNSPVLSLALFRRLATDLIGGLCHLHARGFVHGTLRPECVYTTRLNTKIHLGGIETMLLPRSAAAWMCSRDTVGRMSRYTAPELWQHDDEQDGAKSNKEIRCTPAADIWSLGLILFEMLTGESLLRAEKHSFEEEWSILTDGDDRLSKTHLLRMIQLRQQHHQDHAHPLATVGDLNLRVVTLQEMEWTSELLVEALDLIAQMLQYAPEKRESLGVLRHHLFLTGSSRDTTTQLFVNILDEDSTDGSDDDNDSPSLDHRPAAYRQLESSWNTYGLRAQVLHYMQRQIVHLQEPYWHTVATRLWDTVCIQWNLEQMHHKQLHFRAHNWRTYYCLAATVVWITHALSNSDNTDADWTVDDAVAAFGSLVHALRLEYVLDTAFQPLTALEMCSWQRRVLVLSRGYILLTD